MSKPYPLPKAVQHHKQGTKRNCGQIAVATLTGRSVEYVEKFIGHSHGTKTKELATALAAFGFRSRTRCKSHLEFSATPEFALAQVHNVMRPGWHWIAIGDGKAYDGRCEGPMTLRDYTEWLKPGDKITSYLEVFRRAPE
jgi:hypothetical protein